MRSDLSLPFRSALAVVAVLTFLGGCAQLPPPAFPVLPPGMGAVGVSQAATWAWSRGKVARPDGTIEEVRWNGAGDFRFGGGQGAARLISALFPALIAVRGEITPPLDIGAHLGWQGMGLAGRYRFRPALGVALDAQAGYTFHTYQVKVSADASGLAPGRVILNAGVSLGRWPHFLFVPHGLQREEGSEEGVIGHSGFELNRTEVRLELSAGAGIRDIFLVLQPYIVVASGAPRFGDCYLCAAGIRPIDFSQSFGLALSILFLNVHR